MNVYTSSDIKLLENATVESGTTMEQLMDKAGSAVAAFIFRQWEVKGKRVAIVCGKGNNGGDGFVCAGILKRRGAEVSVILAMGNPSTELARNAYNSMPEGIDIINWESDMFRCESILDNADFVVDAVFGFGFRGKIEGSLGKLMERAGSSKGVRIAVDLPSGAECDTGKVAGACFTADYTVTFTGMKPACVLYPAVDYCGMNVIAPVGIDKSALETYPSTFSVIKEKYAASLLPKKDPQGNKGSFGRLLMICGSYGMIGASVMAARAALRSGVGLLNMAVTKDIYPIIAPMVPEAIFTVMDFTDEVSCNESGEALFSALKAATACLIGCGLGKEASRYVSTVLKFASCPVILDADALNYAAKDPEELAGKSYPVIVTPHPGEMARLTGKTVHIVQQDRFNTAKNFASEYGVYTVLKGAGTLIASPDGEIKINTTGNAGMAKGGSGDVLAGIIASLAAQGMEPMDACSLGVYVHGKAGDYCAEKLSKTAMLPTDLIEELPSVYLKLEMDG